VEDVAYQSTLLFWFEQYCLGNHIEGFYFEPVSPKGKNKNNRIKAGAIRLMKGEVYLHPKVRSIVLKQYEAWQPSRVNNKDDIIDPIGYIEEVQTTYPELMIRQILSEDELGNIRASTELECNPSF
jgi:hypothetical protein